MGETIEFDGRLYLDDRMFVFTTSRCTVSIQDDVEATTIHYKDAPVTAQWCVVTFRNIAGYQPFRVDAFESEVLAIEFLQRIEPQTPRISLNGQAPIERTPYEKYVGWKQENGFADFDYSTLFPAGVEKPCDTLYAHISMSSIK